MPTPKRRTPRAKTARRKAHWKRVTPAAKAECPQCHKPKLPHRVCPHCGTYDGRQVLDLE